MLSCPSIQDILMNHFQYPGQTRAKTMCHKCGWPYLGIQPTWCVRPCPLSSHLLVRGIEYLSTVAVGRRKSTKPAPFILVPLYLDSLHPVNCEVFYPFKKRMSESGESYFDGNQYMKRLADREKAIPRDSPLLIQVSVGVCLFVTKKRNPL